MRDQIRRGFQAPKTREGPRAHEDPRQEPSAVPIIGMSQIRQMAKMEFARAKRYAYPLTLAVCRIDRIDSLTDLYGQESRRLLMSRLASLFAHRARGTDIVGRLSEERLLWVQTHTDLEGARIAADRMRLAVESMEVQSGSKQIPVTLSMGLSCFAEGNTLFFDSILYQAEKALERAQGMGGNFCEEHPLPVPKRARRPWLPGEDPEESTERSSCEDRSIEDGPVEDEERE